MNKGPTPLNLHQIGNENICYSNILKSNLINSEKDLSNINKQTLKFPQPKKRRQIDQNPFRVLDATLLQDDFYISVLDWSERGKIAVGLSNAVFLWGFSDN